MRSCKNLPKVQKNENYCFSGLLFMNKLHNMCNRELSISIGIEVNMILVRNHETLWKSNETRFSLGTVLPRGYNIPRMTFSLGNTKPGDVSTTNAESINLRSAIL